MMGVKKIESLEDFEKAVYDEMFVNLHSFQQDNYDRLWLVGGNGEDKSKDFRINAHVEFLKVFSKNSERFFNTYKLFADQESKSLFLELINFRLAGHLHKRLSLSDKIKQARAKMLSLPTKPSETRFFCPGYERGNAKHYNLEYNGANVKVDSWGVFLEHMFLLNHYCFERDGIKIMPEKGDFIVDAGAFAGETSLGFSSLVGNEGRVFAFEMMPTNLKLLEYNLNQNPELKNMVTIVHKAIGDGAVKQTTVEDYGDVIDIAARPGRAGAKVDIEVISIDEFVQKNNLQKLDFIKSDIEGAERDLLKGAKETLKKFKPKLAISFYHEYDDYFVIPEIIKEIEPEYKFYLDHYTIFDNETVLYAAAS